MNSGNIQPQSSHVLKTNHTGNQNPTLPLKESKLAADVSQVAAKEFKQSSEIEPDKEKVVVPIKGDLSQLGEAQSIQSIPQRGFDPPTVDDLVAGMIKQGFEGEDAANVQAIAETLKDVALYILENAGNYEDIESDVYLRPKDTKLRVPLTFSKGKKVVIHLKSKLGEILGKGAFKVVKNALVLISDLINRLRLSTEQAAAATMTPKTETEKKAAENEKRMQKRLSQLGPHRGIVTCHTVTDYAHKSEAGQNKISVIMEFCNGGNLQEAVENNFRSELTESGSDLLDEELIAITEDVLIGLDFLHDHNIFQSDMKLANILLVKTGQLITGAKIGDFGCGRDLNDEEQRFFFTGDQQYLSPELKEAMLKMQTHCRDELKEVKESLAQAKAKFADSQLKLTENPEDLQLFEENRQAKAALKHAKEEFNKKKEILAEFYRKGICPIDESFLKSDVLSTGMIIQGLYLGKYPEKGKMLDVIQKEHAEALRQENATLESLARALKSDKKRIEKTKAKLLQAQELNNVSKNAYQQAVKERNIASLSELQETITRDAAESPGSELLKAKHKYEADASKVESLEAQEKFEASKLQSREGQIKETEKRIEELKLQGLKIDPHQVENLIAQKEKTLSVEMRALIRGMLEPDRANRLSAKEALKIFRELKEQNKIFSPEREKIAALQRKRTAAEKALAPSKVQATPSSDYRDHYVQAVEYIDDGYQQDVDGDSQIGYYA